MQDALAGPLGRLNGRVSEWLARIAAFIVAVLAVLTFTDVIARYVFNRPFSTTVELTEIGMGLIIWFGVGLVTHVKEHVTVDFVTLRLPPRVQVVLEFVVSIVSLGYLCILVREMWVKAFDLYASGDFMIVIETPLWPIAFLIGIAGILFLTGTLLHIMSALSRIASGRSD